MKSTWKVVEEKNKNLATGVSSATSALNEKGDIVYIFGGRDQNFETSKQFIAFDLNDCKWNSELTKFDETINSGPDTRHGHQSIIVGKKLYVYGGMYNHSKDPCSAEMYIFDLEEHNWTCIKRDFVPKFTTGFSMTCYMNGLYLFGGGKNDIYRFSLDTQSFYLVKNKSDLVPVERSQPVAGTIGHFMYIFGGISKELGLLDDLWRFDYNSRIWKQIKTSRSPSPRIHHACTVLDGKMYIYGGENAFKIFDDIYYFDPNTETWGLVPTHSNYFGRRNHTLFARDNSLYSFGGFWNGKYMNNILKLELPFQCFFNHYLSNATKCFNNIQFYFQDLQN